MHSQIILAVKDHATKSFLTPNFVDSTGGVIRQLRDIVNGVEKHEFKLHPEDYTLYSLGEYDQLTGQIKPSPQGPKVVVDLRSLIEETNNNG